MVVTLHESSNLSGISFVFLHSVRVVPIYQEHYVRGIPHVQHKDMPNKKVVRIEVWQGNLPKIWETGNHQVSIHIRPKRKKVAVALSA